MTNTGLQRLEAALGHTFRNQSLLVQALTHSSLGYELSVADNLTDAVRESSDNEQMEFLGDAVVGLLVADSLFHRYPAIREGQLSRLRAALVSRKHLALVGGKIHLGDYMLLGKGEERSGGRQKPALLANCVEAVIGALYLDSGLDAAREFTEKRVVKPYLASLFRKLESGSSIGDHKSALQEYLQARKSGQPEYRVRSESGPDHRKRFLVEVHSADGEAHRGPLGRGSGSTKKKAEQEAARAALEKLLAEPDRPAKIAEEVFS